MRKLFFIITVISFTVFRSGAQVPEWVTRHPVSDDIYIGIGQASLAESDYIQIATRNALSDIASQIATKVESNSFFHQVDVDGHAREMFEDRINSNASAWLEGQDGKKERGRCRDGARLSDQRQKCRKGNEPHTSCHTVRRGSESRGTVDVHGLDKERH